MESLYNALIEILIGFKKFYNGLSKTALAIIVFMIFVYLIILTIIGKYLCNKFMYCKCKNSSTEINKQNKEI